MSDESLQETWWLGDTEAYIEVLEKVLEDIKIQLEVGANNNIIIQRTVLKKRA